MVRAIEHIVSGDVQEPSTTFLNGSRQIGGRFGIEGGSQLTVAFRFVDGGIGGTVDDAVYFVLCHKLVDCQLVGDVKLFHVSVQPLVVGIVFLKQLQLVAKLPVASSNEYFHNSSFPCLSC